MVHFFKLCKEQVVRCGHVPDFYAILLQMSLTFNQNRLWNVLKIQSVFSPALLEIDQIGL